VTAISNTDFMVQHIT